MPWVLRSACVSSPSAAESFASRERHGELEWAVEARPEPLGEEIVRLARRLVGGIVAGVAGGEPESERRRGERQHHRGCGDRGHGGAPLHPLHPAQPEAWPRPVRVAGSLASAHLADPPADQAEEGGQQGERCREYEHDPDRGCDRGAVEQAHAEREHPEQRDHDRGAGEQHGAAGGVERRLDRLLHVAAVGAVVLAKARDDEQRVVDADAEADHQRQLGGEARHVDHVAGEVDHPDPGAEAEQRGRDREPHRAERSEADQQDHDRGRDPDDRRESERCLLGLLDRLAAELDVERGRTRRLGGRDHVVDGRLRERVRALVEVHRGEGDRSVTGDRVLAGGVRADDARDVGEAGDALQRRRDRRPIGRVRELARLGVEHDLVGVPGLGGEMALEQIDGLLRVRCPAA